IASVRAYSRKSGPRLSRAPGSPRSWGVWNGSQPGSWTVSSERWLSTTSTSRSAISPSYTMENSTTWNVPSISWILARWLRSTMSSAISGWRSRSWPMSSMATCSGAVTSTQTRASGSSSAVARPSRSVIFRVPAGVHAMPRMAGHASPRPSDGAVPAGAPGSSLTMAREYAAPVGPTSRLGSDRRDLGLHGPPPRPRPVQQQRRRHGGERHGGRDQEHADHDPRRLARRPCLERLDHEPVAQRPVAERLGDERQVGVGRRVDLVVQAVDGRGPVGGQERAPPRPAHHPRDRDRRPGGALS